MVFRVVVRDAITGSTGDGTSHYKLAVAHFCGFLGGWAIATASLSTSPANWRQLALAGEPE